LHFEAYTLMVSDMRRRVDRGEEDVPRRLPAPEREARRLRQAAGITGISLDDENECAHSLIDKAVQMMEDDMLKYIPLDECVTRGQELQAVDRKDKSLKTDARGFVRESSTAVSLTADTSSDYKVRSAFLRRGLAFDQAQIMSFESHEKLPKMFFKELMREPPPGFRRVTLDQVIRADREVFRKLAEMTRSGVKPESSGNRPIDTCIVSVLESASVQLLLLPLPGGNEKRHNEANNDGQGPGKRSKKAEKRHRAEERAKTKPAEQTRKFGASASSGPSKHPMPKGLQGNVAKTEDGRFICFGFNLPTGCGSKGIKRGDRCPKGYHVCCKPGCAEAHPLGEHPS
jgi:hypothetical protein